MSECRQPSVIFSKIGRVVLPWAFYQRPVWPQIVSTVVRTCVTCQAFSQPSTGDSTCAFLCAGTVFEAFGCNVGKPPRQQTMVALVPSHLSGRMVNGLTATLRLWFDLDDLYPHPCLWSKQCLGTWGKRPNHWLRTGSTLLRSFESWISQGKTSFAFLTSQSKHF